MRSTWYMLTRDEEYREPDAAAADPARKEREAKRLVGKLKKLGYEVEMPVTAK
jgi:hypothetical protein